MKRWLMLLVIASLYCSACKKEGADNSAWFIKAKFNGTEKTFSDSPSALEYSGDLSAGFSMNAKNDSGNSSFSLGIVHPFGVEITPGSYNKPSNGYYPSGNYIKDTVSYVSGILMPDSSTIQITISNLTNTTVTGTFSGTLHNRNDSTEEITITNGSFNLPVK